ncbi:MAG: SDR family NAD(P)-dependent oxidoreductase [Methylococcales bacterium]|nr:SDR family NAD(P)-dependent oxidoreductase [Methylococcales bacterium]
MRFAEGIKQFFNDPDQVLLEVGAGRTLSNLAKRHPDKPADQLTFTSVRPPHEAISDVTFLLKTLGQLWLHGVDIDWGSYYGEDRHSRIPLPTYPFERHRYWMDAKRLVSLESTYTGKKSDTADWFYVTSWKRVNLLVSQQKPLEAPVLVFIDELGHGDQLIEKLATQVNPLDIIAVKAGESFEQSSPRLFSINPGYAQDYQSLIQALQAQALIPKSIIHCWNVTDADAAALDISLIDASQNTGFYSLLHLAQALGQQNIDSEIELLVVSNQLQNIMGEEIVLPLKATLIGPVRVIPQEYQNIRCRSVDTVINQQNSARVIAQIISELQHESDDDIIAYRGNARWVESFEPQHLPKPADAVTELPFKPQGVYLITGGMGGMGLVFAEYLAKTVQARLVLIARSTLPEREVWKQWLASHAEEDPTSIKINKIKLMEEMGGKILVCSADVTNQAQMAEILTQAQQQFGQINGVIHTAGVAGGGVIQLKTRDTAHNVLAPKVDGTIILDTLLKENALDFMVVCSSMEAALGSPGQVDYCAANNFLDAYAQSKASDSNRLTLSINWDAWQEVGMAVETAKYGLDNKVLEVKKLDHHLFDKCIIEKTREIYISTLIPDKHWIIGEHIVLNTPSLVGTAYLEIARSAYECHSGKSTMELQDVYFLKFLFVEEDEEKEVRTILTPTENGANFSIQSLDADSSEWSVHAQGKVVPKDFPEQVKYNIDELETSCDQDIAVPDLQALPDYTRYGSRWLNNIQWRKASEHHNLALMELPQAFAEDVEVYKFHPSLVDTATYVVADVLPNELASQFDFFTESSAYLPYFYERVTIKGALPTRFYSYTTRELQGHDWSINLSFLDSNGIELVSIKNYLLKYIDSAYTLKDDQKSKETQQRQTQLIDTSLSHAVLPQEGIDSLERLLQSRLPQAIVSTTDFDYQKQLLKQQPEDTEDEEILFDRPQLSQDYEEPQSPTEQAIAKVWQRVLGIKNIGVHDNFFDLGGDSLIVVQILLELRQALKVSTLNFRVKQISDLQTLRFLSDKIRHRRHFEFTTNSVINIIIKTHG